MARARETRRGAKLAWVDPPVDPMKRYEEEAARQRAWATYEAFKSVPANGGIVNIPRTPNARRAAPARRGESTAAKELQDQRGREAEARREADQARAELQALEKDMPRLRREADQDERRAYAARIDEVAKVRAARKGRAVRPAAELEQIKEFNTWNLEQQQKLDTDILRERAKLAKTTTNEVHQ
jgi:hypothetical protein